MGTFCPNNQTLNRIPGTIGTLRGERGWDLPGRQLDCQVGEVLKFDKPGTVAAALKLGGSVSVEGIRSVRSAPAPSSGRRLLGRAPRMRSSRRLLTQKAAKEAGGSSSRRLSSSPGLDVHFNNQRVHSTEDGEHRSVYSAPAGSFRDNTLTNKFRKMNMNF